MAHSWAVSSWVVVVTVVGFVGDAWGGQVLSQNWPLLDLCLLCPLLVRQGGASLPTIIWSRAGVANGPLHTGGNIMQMSDYHSC